MDDEGVMLYFPHLDWEGDKKGNYTQDVRGELGGSEEWEFELKCGLDNTPIVLLWSGITGTGQENFTLVDQQTGERVDMREASSYAFVYGQGESSERVPLSDAPVYRFSVQMGTLSETEGVVRAKMPDRFRLGHAYPNPFNAVTIIPYEVPEMSWVKIGVYNVLGQKVATLVDAMEQPGYYQARWDGSGGTGLAVGTGIYVCRMQAGSFTDVKRFLLVK
jgi:hypothetical protein